MSLYQVVGPVPYRNHPPGSVFEATLEEKTEERAIRRKAIKLLDTTAPKLRDGSWTLPRKEGSNA